MHADVFPTMASVEEERKLPKNSYSTELEVRVVETNSKTITKKEI